MSNHHYSNSRFTLLPLVTLFLFACSKEPRTETAITKMTTSKEKEEVFIPVGKWLVTEDLCKQTLNHNALEAITLTEASVKMGNSTLVGDWVTASKEDVQSMTLFINENLPECISLNISDFNVGSYLSNQVETVFAVSNEQNVVVRLHKSAYSFAFPYSDEAVKAVLSDPFKDEPLPYDPFL